MSYFDIQQIPNSVIDKYYTDYEDLYDDVNFLFLNEDYIIEVEGSPNQQHTPTSAYDVIESLKRQYDISNFQCKVLHPNGVNLINIDTELPDYLVTNHAFLIPNIKTNCDIIINFLKDKGYYLAKKGEHKDHKGRLWYELTFDPIKQLNIAQQVINKHRYAYHTTPIQNANSINVEGIIAPKAFHPYESYQKMIYLFLGNPDSNEYIEMMNGITKNISLKDKNFLGDFVEYEIRLDKLPNSVEMFTDVQRCSKDFVYITTDIPTSAITNSEEKTYG